MRSYLCLNLALVLWASNSNLTVKGDQPFIALAYPLGTCEGHGGVFFPEYNGSSSNNYNIMHSGGGTRNAPLWHCFFQLVGRSKSVRRY